VRYVYSRILIIIFQNCKSDKIQINQKNHQAYQQHQEQDNFTSVFENLMNSMKQTPSIHTLIYDNNIPFYTWNGVVHKSCTHLNIRVLLEHQKMLLIVAGAFQQFEVFLSKPYVSKEQFSYFIFWITMDLLSEKEMNCTIHRY